MASKPRTSLRRKLRNPKEEDDTTEVDDAFEELKSPTRKRFGEAGLSNAHSPRICSAVVTPTNKGKQISSSEEAYLDESSDKLSQEPTPSKWSYLLPDYYSSQADGSVCDVLWDCASPDAIKHLRRRRKDDKSIKEILKNFKDGPPKEGANKSPSLQLHLLRASLRQQLQQQQNRSNNASRQQRKLVRKRKQLQQTKEQTKHLFDQILSAVEKRQELEAQREGQRTTGSEMSPSSPATEAASTEDDVNNDCWEDDDLFQDNSFIINATQDPFQFLRTSDDGTSTPKPAMENAAQSADTSSARQVNERFHLNNNSNSVLDSQNSGVIPPTFVPGQARPTAQPSGSLSSNALGGCEKNLQSADGIPRSLAARNASLVRSNDSCVTSSFPAPLDSPRSRFPAQRKRSVTLTPKRLLQPSNPRSNPVCTTSNPVNPSPSGPVPPTPNCVPQSVNLPSNLDGRQGSIEACMQQKPPSGSKLSLPSSRTSSSSAELGTMLQSCTLGGSKVTGCASRNRPVTVTDRRTKPVGAYSNKPAGVPDRQANLCTKSNKPVSVPDRQMNFGANLNKAFSVTDRQTKPTGANSDKTASVTNRQTNHLGANSVKLVNVTNRQTKPIGANSNKPVSDTHRQTKPGGAQNCVGSRQVNGFPDKVGGDMSNDGLSDELLLKLTEEDDEFDSQAIQEFPTQAPAKLSAPTNLMSVKTANAHCDDFLDDLDPEILASICEYDSFSESPQRENKANSPSTKTVPLKSCKQFKSGPSDEKQPKLEESIPCKTSTTTYNMVVGGGTAKTVMSDGKKCGLTFYPPTSTKPTTLSNNRGQNYRSASSTAILGNVQSGNSHQNPRPDSNKGLVYPPFGQSQQARPLSSLAGGNIIIEKQSQTGRKFVFKSTKSHSTTLAAQNRSEAASTCSKCSPSKDVISAADAAVDRSCSQARLDSDDDLLADDALYESQIIALLDEVESQATQQTSSQCVGSQSKNSPEKCSQEEIEKKRQAALQRKLRSRTKTK